MLDNPETNPQVQEVTAEAAALATTAAAYTVATAADYSAAGDELKRVKAAQKRLDETRKGMTRPLDAAKKAILDLFRGPEEKLADAEAGIKRAMVRYSDEQERLRREEQRRAEEAARAERERIAAAAREVERKAREKAEANRKAAEEAAAAGRAAEAAKLMARAEATEEKAAAKVEQLEVQQAAQVAPVVQVATPKMTGVSTRTVWKYEVIDANLVPRQYLSVDEAKIGKVVRALGGDANIPGVRIYSERVVAAGAA